MIFDQLKKKKKKKSEKITNQEQIYPKNHEYFKNSKPRVQFYWFF